MKLTLSVCRNNAGKYCKKLQFTKDKFEMTFATNYLGKPCTNACSILIFACTV